MIKKDLEEQEKKFEVCADDVFDESDVLKIQLPSMRMALGKRVNIEETTPLLVTLKRNPELIGSLINFKGTFTDFNIVLFSSKKKNSRKKKRDGVVWVFEEASISAMEFGELSQEDSEEPSEIRCEINYSDFIVKSL